MQNSAAPRGMPTVSKLLPGGGLVELVYAPDARKTALAIYEHGHCRIADKLDLAPGERLVPIPATNNLIRHDAIVLPERPEPYGDVPTLVAEIERYIDRYVSVSEWFRRLSAYYILFTWVYDAFVEVPYLRVQADWGSGKTRALIVIGSLCYRAFFASGASTVSPIFHTLDTFKGTLILDEADFRFSDQTAELTKILNNGNVKGFPVFRTAITQKREFDPRAFEVFGPKFVAMRKSFEDDALESRFITERLSETRMRPDIPINLPASQKDEARGLRNKLLQYRFEHQREARANASLVDPSLSPRTNQILVPLLSIIPDETVRADLRRAVRILDADRAAARSMSTEAELLSIITELSRTDPTAPIPLAAIAARFIEKHAKDYDRPLTNRYLGGVLRHRLGMTTYKTGGVYAVAVDPLRLIVLASRYGVAPVDTVEKMT